VASVLSILYGRYRKAFFQYGCCYLHSVRRAGFHGVCFIAMTRASSRRLPTSLVGSSSPDTTFIGQMSWTTAHNVVGRAVTHFVRLSIFDWGIRLGPATRILGLITPTLEFRFDEIRSANAVRGSRPFRLPGVRFKVPEANVIAVFWTNSYAAVLDRLSARGVPLTRVETQIGFKPLDT
jgi:hypothetical protein